MTNTIKIDLDITWDYYNSAAYARDLAQFNLADELIALEGPAGGMPYVWLKGTRNDLVDLLKHWGSDDEDIAFDLENAQAV